MKYIVACLLGLGIVSGVNAQDNAGSTESFSCYYVDEKTFVCNMGDARGINQGEMNTGGSTSSKHENNTKQEAAGEVKGRSTKMVKQSPKRKKDRYQEPEKESDTGILGEDGLYRETEEVDEAAADAKRKSAVQGEARRETDHPAPSGRDSLEIAN